jgi:hypothetical protein
MSGAKGAAARKRQQELDRGSSRAQALREAPAEKRVRRGERFPRTGSAREPSAGFSRSAIAASDWRQGMATNPKAQLGGSHLGPLAERGLVRRTRPLSWALLTAELLPSGFTRLTAKAYRTEVAARAMLKHDGYQWVEYRGNRRDRARTAIPPMRKKHS